MAVPPDLCLAIQNRRGAGGRTGEGTRNSCTRRQTGQHNVVTALVFYTGFGSGKLYARDFRQVREL